MEAIVGRYRICIEDTEMLVLRHPTGLLFEFTAREALDLLAFLRVYRQVLGPAEREEQVEHLEEAQVRHNQGHQSA